VTFTVSGYWTEAGVRVGPYTFAVSMPGRPPASASRCSPSLDTPRAPCPGLRRNPSAPRRRRASGSRSFPSASARATSRFRSRSREGRRRARSQRLRQPGSALSEDQRGNARQNNQALADLRLKTEERVLWSGPFRRYGKTESEFADTRNYVYQGKTIDRQTHLASTSPTCPRRGGSGQRRQGVWPIAWASTQLLVLDHGYGLQSIYGT